MNLALNSKYFRKHEATLQFFLIIRCCKHQNSSIQIQLKLYKYSVKTTYKVNFMLLNLLNCINSVCLVTSFQCSVMLSPLGSTYICEQIFSIHYLLRHQRTRVLRRPPPSYMPDSMQYTRRTHPVYEEGKWKHW